MDNVFSLASDEVEELTRKAQVRKLPRQALVVSEGDRTDSLYIILSGRVKVFLADETRRARLRSSRSSLRPSPWCRAKRSRPSSPRARTSPSGSSRS